MRRDNSEKHADQENRNKIFFGSIKQNPLNPTLYTPDIRPS